MNPRRFLMPASVALVACGIAFAQAPPQAPKPGPENKKLEYFVGHWDSTGDMKPGPMGPGGKFMMKDHCEWFSGKFAVVCNSEGKTPNGPMKGLGILGYSTEDKVYTYYGLDSSGMLQMSAAKGTIAGNVWTYTDEGKMMGKMYKSRYTITIVSPTEYTSVWELQNDDGSWASLMQAKSTKKKV